MYNHSMELPVKKKEENRPGSGAAKAPVGCRGSAPSKETKLSHLKTH